jgi:hypothetical protein
MTTSICKAPADHVGVFHIDDNTTAIEWYGTTFYDNDNNNYTSATHPIKFQIVLHSDGHIDWNMNTLHYDKYSNGLFTGAYDGGAEDLYIAGFGLKNDNESYGGDFSGSGHFNETTAAPNFSGVIS